MFFLLDFYPNLLIVLFFFFLQNIASFFIIFKKIIIFHSINQLLLNLARLFAGSTVFVGDIASVEVFAIDSFIFTVA